MKEGTEKDEIKYISKSLLKQRGCTESMIKTFLEEPDIETDNPIYRSAASMKLYDMKRVLAAESGESLIERKLKAEKRSKTMKNVADLKKQELMEQIEPMTFKIKVISEENLLQNAVRSYNDFHEMIAMERNNFLFDYATPKSDKAFLERI